MHFSKIYIQDNFIPDIATDQYRRKVIGVEVTVNDGEDLDEAKEAAENYIKEYIQSNKIESPHIQEQSLPPEPTILPEIQVEKTPSRSIVDSIVSADTLEELKEYELLASMNHKLKELYDDKFKYLTLHK